jgi:hypothetical protein
LRNSQRGLQRHTTSSQRKDTILVQDQISQEGNMQKYVIFSVLLPISSGAVTLAEEKRSRS